MSLTREQIEVWLSALETGAAGGINRADAIPIVRLALRGLDAEERWNERPDVAASRHLPLPTPPKEA